MIYYKWLILEKCLRRKGKIGKRWLENKIIEKVEQIDFVYNGVMSVNYLRDKFIGIYFV